MHSKQLRAIYGLTKNQLDYIAKKIGFHRGKGGAGFKGGQYWPRIHREKIPLMMEKLGYTKESNLTAKHSKICNYERGFACCCGME